MRLTTPETLHLHVDMKSSIGDLAARFGLPTHVLRHWEQMGLLTPERSTAGHRLYGEADAARIVLIQLAKEAGLSLEQARRLLTDARDRQSRRDLYAAHAETLRRRIAAAEAALALVEHAAECDADDFTTCPHLAAKVAGRL
ncbi:MerR family transcriptional regulator [Actinoplanes capillaceus]|uniref:MerR family transcriptional regulator n=2 Tax=Actinoplanes campanulatus TaxID=113559 RepID=A0ABQ3WHW8_9ACTN|nr:MerR family transcriptional regulator [Actinoplanes capillaceus]